MDRDPVRQRQSGSDSGEYQPSRIAFSELEFCLRKVSCRALITAERLKSSDYLAMLRVLVPELDGCTPQGG